MKKRKDRDGIFFRVKRDKWEAICFSDLTVGEMREVMRDKPEGWLESLVVQLEKSGEWSSKEDLRERAIELGKKIYERDL